MSSIPSKLRHYKTGAYFEIGGIFTKPSMHPVCTWGRQIVGVGGRHILGGCKRYVNFLPEFPIVLSENLPE